MNTGPTKVVADKQLLPAWIAITFGVFTPILVTFNVLLTKHLVSKRIGFDPSTLTFSALAQMNFLIFVFAAIPYWKKVEFDKNMFITGLWGSIVNAVAIVFIQNANKRGPLGPVAAIGAMYSPLLVIVEALK